MELSMHDDCKYDQAMGMYLGLAIGDALGAPWAYHEPNVFVDWKEIEMRSGGEHNVITGEWTDETAMTRCIADAYIRWQRFDVETIYENFCAWEDTGHLSTRDEVFDIDITCMTAIGNYKQGVAGEKYRGVDDAHAQSSGGIVRLAPVILANINDLTRCRLEAIESTMLTHASETCVLYADKLARDLWEGKLMGHNPTVFTKQTKSTGQVADTYYSAWQAVLATGSFEDALKRAVCRGGRADTVGAVAGMIAGRIYGKSAIPEKWLDALIMKNELLEEANQLYTLGMCRA